MSEGSHNSILTILRTPCTTATVRQAGQKVRGRRSGDQMASQDLPNYKHVLATAVDSSSAMADG